MNSANWTCLACSENDTVQLGAVFADALQAPAGEVPFVIYLQGELGSGKTTFARALIQSLGYSGRVKSPTYGLLESYLAGQWAVIHLDLYRIEDPAELEFLALRDMLVERSLLLVEWPDNGAAALPAADLTLDFTQRGEAHVITCHAHSDRGIALAGQAYQRPELRNCLESALA